jgi:hypothetical protein
MIQISKISEPLFSNELILFQKKLIHIVCMADRDEDSYCMQYLNICKLSTKDSNLYIDEVNKKNELGCLYPQYNLSIIPSIDLTNDLVNKSDQIETYLTDALINANELYYKCDTMLFVFEKSNSPDNHKMNLILEHFLEKYTGKIKHLNTILTNLE